MPDVTDPQAGTEAVESPEAVAEEKQVSSEEAQALQEKANAAQDEFYKENDAQEAAASAAELRAQLAAKDAEIAALKAAPKAEEPAKPAAPPQGRMSNIQLVQRQVIPEARKVFVDPNSTVQQQFDVLLDAQQQMLGAVLVDSINPYFENLATANIGLANELEIRDIRSEDSTFAKQLEPKVKAELDKMRWEDRGKPGAVKSVYYRLLGESNGKRAAEQVAAKPNPAAVLRDVSAGMSGGGAKSPGIRLTKEQEADRLDMSTDGSVLSPENYLAKLKARQDRAKATNRKVPSTLREL